MIRLQIPLILIENVPRLLKSRTWARASELLEGEGYAWTAVFAMRSTAACLSGAGVFSCWRRRGRSLV